MDIVDYIPFGRENAVTRAQLRSRTGIDDRTIRDMIADARRDTVILNMQDGKGYFRPLPEERHLVEAYAKQETARLKSIGWSLKATRQMLKNW
jgi:hypothetical protein|nr:MAG TPA: winged helix-turn-helix transcription repressor [Caudoviricetes sp.]